MNRRIEFTSEELENLTMLLASSALRYSEILSKPESYTYLLGVAASKKICDQLLAKLEAPVVREKDRPGYFRDKYGKMFLSEGMTGL